MRNKLLVPPRLRQLMRRAAYPLLCLLCLACLPYQPDNDPVSAAAQLAQNVMGSTGVR